MELGNHSFIGDRLHLEPGTLVALVFILGIGVIDVVGHHGFSGTQQVLLGHIGGEGKGQIFLTGRIGDKVCQIGGTIRIDSCHRTAALCIPDRSHQLFTGERTLLIEIERSGRGSISAVHRRLEFTLLCGAGYTVHRIVLAASGEQKQHCHQTSDQSKTGTVHAFTSLVSLALSQRIQLTGCPLMIEATHLELQYTQYRIESV